MLPHIPLLDDRSLAPEHTSRNRLLRADEGLQLRQSCSNTGSLEVVVVERLKRVQVGVVKRIQLLVRLGEHAIGLLARVLPNPLAVLSHERLWEVKHKGRGTATSGIGQHGRQPGLCDTYSTGRVSAGL